MAQKLKAEYFAQYHETYHCCCFAIARLFDIPQTWIWYLCFVSQMRTNYNLKGGKKQRKENTKMATLKHTGEESM